MFTKIKERYATNNNNKSPYTTLPHESNKSTKNDSIQSPDRSMEEEDKDEDEFELNKRSN